MFTYVPFIRVFADNQVTRDIHGWTVDIPSNMVIHSYSDRVGMGYMCMYICRYSDTGDMGYMYVHLQKFDRGGMGYICAYKNESWIFLVTWSSNGYSDRGGMGYMGAYICGYSDRVCIGYMCTSEDEPWISIVTWSSIDETGLMTIILDMFVQISCTMRSLNLLCWLPPFLHQNKSYIIYNVHVCSNDALRKFSTPFKPS